MLNGLVTLVRHSAPELEEWGGAIWTVFASIRVSSTCPAAAEAAPADDVAAAIGTDERRMHVRAYNYWVSLLDGRDYPVDRGPRARATSPISRRTASCSTSPAAATIRRRPTSAPRSARNAASTTTSRTIADVPSRSLLSRLTDHYLQIIANRAPVGFEAEFVNQRGADDLLSRHPDAVLVRRRHDRFHLRRDQLEGRRRRRERRAGHRARPIAAEP